MIEKYLVWRPLHHQFFHRHRPELALSIPGKAANNNNSGKSLNAFERLRFADPDFFGLDVRPTCRTAPVKMETDTR